MFVQSDKTVNIYSMPPDKYNELILKELHSGYKHTTRKALKDLNDMNSLLN